MKEKQLIVFFGTNDLEKTHEFYHGFLGLKLCKDQGKCRIYQVSQDGSIGFCTHMEIKKGEKTPIITIVCDEVDEMYQMLRKRGIIIEKPPIANKEFDIYHFFCKDPNGYWVEFQHFL